MVRGGAIRDHSVNSPFAHVQPRDEIVGCEQNLESRNRWASGLRVVRLPLSQSELVTAF